MMSAERALSRKVIETILVVLEPAGPLEHVPKGH